MAGVKEARGRIEAFCDAPWLRNATYPLVVDALRPALGVVWMLALAGCGQSVRTAEQANPTPTPGGASATGGSGFAGGTNAGSGVPREVESVAGRGSLLVSNAGAATAWRVREPFESSEALWSKGGEGAFNTDVSDDGRMVVISGDVRLALDAPQS
jgi:hypothetical protein